MQFGLFEERPHYYASLDDLVQAMMKMEDEFGIEIPEGDAENLKSIKDVIGYIEAKKQ